MTVTDLDRDAADKLLTTAKGNVKTAIVMNKLQIEYDEAMMKLGECDGFVRRVLNK